MSGLLAKLRHLPVALRDILCHPAARGRRLQVLGRWLYWQVRLRLSRGAPVTAPWVEGLVLRVRPGETAATLNLYLDYAEPDSMLLVRRILRAGDLFVDVGANVGTFTLMAAGAAGAHVLAVEPHVAARRSLQENLRANSVSALVEVAPCAATSTAGMVRFVDDRGAMSHLARDWEEGVQVEGRRLDDLLDGRVPQAIKIDVEGAEAQVLAGAAHCLYEPGLFCVIAEIGPAQAEVEAMLRRAGFAPAIFAPDDDSVRPLGGASFGGANGLYLRDWDRVRRRLATWRDTGRPQ